MKCLPDNVAAAREIANSCSDELHNAWNILNAKESPSTQDVEAWLEVKRKFDAAQDEFELLLRQYLDSGLNA